MNRSKSLKEPQDAEWHKFLAIVLIKLGCADCLIIDMADLKAAQGYDTVVAEELGGAIVLRVLKPEVPGAVKSSRLRGDGIMPWWFFLVMALAGGLIGYVAIAGMIYRFHHPTMTETQLMFHFWDAMWMRG